MKFAIIFAIAISQAYLIVGNEVEILKDNKQVNTNENGEIIAEGNTAENLANAKEAVRAINQSVINGFDEIEENAQLMYNMVRQDLDALEQENPPFSEYAEEAKALLNESAKELKQNVETARENVLDAAQNVFNMNDVLKYQEELVELQQLILTRIKPAADHFQSIAGVTDTMIRSLPIVTSPSSS